MVLSESERSGSGCVLPRRIQLSVEWVEDETSLHKVAGAGLSLRDEIRSAGRHGGGGGGGALTPRESARRRPARDTRARPVRRPRGQRGRRLAPDARHGASQVTVETRLLHAVCTSSK